MDATKRLRSSAEKVTEIFCASNRKSGWQRPHDFSPPPRTRLWPEYQQMRAKKVFGKICVSESVGACPRAGLRFRWDARGIPAMVQLSRRARSVGELYSQEEMALGFYR